MKKEGIKKAATEFYHMGFCTNSRQHGHGDGVKVSKKLCRQCFVSAGAAVLAQIHDQALEEAAILAQTGAIDRCAQHEKSGKGACGHDLRDGIRALKVRQS